MEFDLPSYDETPRPGKLLCIGSNYAQHIEEMGSAVPDEPLVFLKPATALVRDGGEVVLPARSQEVHHEVELVAIIGRRGKHIPETQALDYVAGYGIGLDMTARDVQQAARDSGGPWSIAKGFDTFAPLGPLVGARQVPDPQALDLELAVNGEVRQAAATSDMIFGVAQLVAYCSQLFTLEPGDLIYTGTPEGVGPVEEGDVLEAVASGLPDLRVSVRREAQ